MTKIHIAIPAHDELAFLPQTIQSIFQAGKTDNIQVYICINQIDSWWEDNSKQTICQANQTLWNQIEQLHNPQITLIDKFSKGNGWTDKKNGVGMARKLLINNILQNCTSDDIIVNIDADTLIEKDYFSQLEYLFSTHKMSALSVPYWHSLSGNEAQDKAMLRYEIYMRTYLINLLKINSPYSFTALGSNIVCTAKAYKAIGGFDTQQSGEDFYFLQKMAKYNPIALYCNKKVYPANRCSSRVPFGTGPAIQKGLLNDFKAYPIFAPQEFDNISLTYNILDDLFEKDIDTEMLSFLQQLFQDKYFLTPLRKNSKTISQFKKAFHQKVDALRIFQYLRQHHFYTDEEAIYLFFEQYLPQFSNILGKNFTFAKSSVSILEQIRQILWTEEEKLRLDFDKKYIYK